MKKNKITTKYFLQIEKANCALTEILENYPSRGINRKTTNKNYYSFFKKKDFAERSWKRCKRRQQWKTISLK